MSFQKAKAAIAGSVLAAVMAVSALGGSLIQAIGSEYKGWKQYGSSWSSLYLGSSGQTTAKIGCAVTSAAMLMVHSGSVTDESFTPGTIISYLNANGGFSSSGAINWNKLSGYAPSFVYVRNEKLSGTQQQKADKMQGLLNEGYYLIAQVNYGGHFVAIDSINGSNVTMMDPGSKSTSLFDKYAAGGVISLRVFKGANSQAVSVPEPTEPETIPEPETTAPVETDLPEETAAVEETTIVEEEIETTESETVDASEETTTETDSTNTTSEETTTAAATTQAAETTATEAISTAKPVTTEAATQPVAATEPPMPATEAPAATVPATQPAPVVQTTMAVPPAPTVPTTTLPAPPMPTVPTTTEAPVIPETAPITPVMPAPDKGAAPLILPSQAEAGLFEIGNQYYFMQVRFLTMDNIHLRAEPDTNADILLLVPKGAYLDVVEVNEDYTWGRVNVNGRDGWISLNYTGI